ncbi:conserved hypothetical protein [Rhodococcus sp. RD6.2]|jgi:hypothetical protein|uniref:hypothetical protein n=1 Tax=Rhodococcus sp. RD6.2 TaxID=260936 RepID=UPI00063B8E5B|nr:hypothetical protein [Rhodococcus sp. RD6.2]CRK52307.1 conserved hypothetical protein [Rhodococcus sp. RD6.2]
MESVRCTTCSTRVLVEKYSEAHTSIQWLGDVDSACPQFAESHPRDGRARVPTCHNLQESIDGLTLSGQIGMSLRSYPIPGRLE